MKSIRGLLSAGLILAMVVTAHAQPPFVRKGDAIVEAPESDLKVARSYSDFKDKGEVIKGLRITIMTAKTVYEVGEEIRVIHVSEATMPGSWVYVMGPKTVDEEYVDGKLAEQQGPDMASINGEIVEGPAVDSNYAITSYRFAEPGTHTVQWQGGGWGVLHRVGVTGNIGLKSNTLDIIVKKRD